MRKVHLHAVCIVVGLLLPMSDGNATGPEENCDARDRLVGLLRGAPHYERHALTLQDRMPSQGHRFEFFMNSGERGRHSYTLIRTRQNEKKTCIVSAGEIEEKHIDNKGREHLKLNDENDPDIFDLVTCNSYYVIMRKFADEGICDGMAELSGSTSVIVSNGDITEDYRVFIPWPEYRPVSQLP